ncbi:MAG: tRNA (N6-isopentenyl adenosine(37)-C2)-methylthiotransferase MiaB [Chloroflexi bacterium]|nr:tRNA (N6-isopentenyl adenosine(37)-C2)-methylthiotransferase MiaB [Chloroflexota bacterium]
MKYHITTYGCQMNTADSQRLASELEKLGLCATPDAEAADVVVLNTCVVRQGPEDKAISRLMQLKPLKTKNPDVIFGVMGCLVGVREPKALREKFPFVDTFLPPSDPSALVKLLQQRGVQAETGREDYWLERDATETRYALQDADFILPAHERGQLVSAHVPIIFGCNHVCTFCVIPYRRGAERSRSLGEIAAHARSLVAQGVEEITLLGQIVDRYGYDIPDGPRLPDLLRIIHDIDGLERLRFLTSHPNYLSDELLDTIAELPKVCEHIEVPIQAGDDEVLRRMKRGYTVDDYRALIEKIRARVPNVSIATDIIVGFPGETEKQFQGTHDLLQELKLDVAHVAMYSPRPNTASASRFPDDVPHAEKERRRIAIDDLQSEVVGAINAKFLGQPVEVLVEEKHKTRWKGRTRNNKLVFFEDDTREWKGQLAHVKIYWTGPWSMLGTLEAHNALTVSGNGSVH